MMLISNLRFSGLDLRLYPQTAPIIDGSRDSRRLFRAIRADEKLRHRLPGAADARLWRKGILSKAGADGSLMQFREALKAGRRGTFLPIHHLASDFCESKPLSPVPARGLLHLRPQGVDGLGADELRVKWHCSGQEHPKVITISGINCIGSITQDLSRELQNDLGASLISRTRGALRSVQGNLSSYEAFRAFVTEQTQGLGYKGGGLLVKDFMPLLAKLPIIVGEERYNPNYSDKS